jgi:hypothetical protein
VKADGEIISTILSLRDETVFTRPANVHRFKFETMRFSLNEFTLGSGQPPSQLETRDDHCSRAEIFS